MHNHKIFFPKRTNLNLNFNTGCDIWASVRINRRHRIKIHQMLHNYNVVPLLFLSHWDISDIFVSIPNLCPLFLRSIHVSQLTGCLTILLLSIKIKPSSISSRLALGVLVEPARVSFPWWTCFDLPSPTVGELSTPLVALRWSVFLPDWVIWRPRVVGANGS